MVDQTNGLDAGLNAGQGGLTAPVHQVENQGRFYTQAELNSMSHKIRQEAEERVLRQPEYFAQKNAGSNYQGDMKAQFEDQLNSFKRQWENEYVEKQQAQQRQYYEQQAQQDLNKNLATWEEKKKLGLAKYPDFFNGMTENEWASFAGVFKGVLDNCDNAEDVLYELSKNPKEIMNLESQRQREIALRKEGFESNMSIKILSQMSKELKDKNNSSHDQKSGNAQAGMPGTSVDLRTETNNYMNNLGSSTVLSVDRQGPQAVSDFDKMFKGQF